MSPLARDITVLVTMLTPLAAHGQQNAATHPSSRATSQPASIPASIPASRPTSMPSRRVEVVRVVVPPAGSGPGVSAALVRRSFRTYLVDVKHAFGPLAADGDGSSAVLMWHRRGKRWWLECRIAAPGLDPLSIWEHYRRGQERRQLRRLALKARGIFRAIAIGAPPPKAIDTPEKSLVPSPVTRVRRPGPPPVEQRFFVALGGGGRWHPVDSHGAGRVGLRVGFRRNWLTLDASVGHHLAPSESDSERSLDVGSTRVELGLGGIWELAPSWRAVFRLGVGVEWVYGDGELKGESSRSFSKTLAVASTRLALGWQVRAWARLEIGGGAHLFFRAVEVFVAERRLYGSGRVAPVADLALVFSY